MPRSQDMAIFMVTTDRQTTDYFTPVHARRVTNISDDYRQYSHNNNTLHAWSLVKTAISLFQLLIPSL